VAAVFEFLVQIVQQQRLQDLQDRLSDQAIHHRRNAQLVLAAAGLGDFHPRNGCG
jgi:hypothetical protein